MNVFNLLSLSDYAFRTQNSELRNLFNIIHVKYEQCYGIKTL